jgi:hypothetical protein
MTPSTQDSEDKPSEWTRLPASKEEKGNGGARVREAIEHGADHVASALGRGMRKAGDVLGAPASTEVEELMGGSDLPELEGDDPIAELGIRLDRESDFWRALALKALGRAAWADRTAHLTSVVAAIGCAALASVAGLEAMFGGAPMKSLLVLAGATALVTGTTVVALISSSIRRSQRETAQESLTRADLSELRLHRVAVVMAIRREDPSGMAEALKRLEHDTSAPTR